MSAPKKPYLHRVCGQCGEGEPHRSPQGSSLYCDDCLRSMLGNDVELTGCLEHAPVERRGFDLTDDQLEDLVRHFEKVKPLTEDERRRAQAALREAASKFRMRR